MSFRRLLSAAAGLLTLIAGGLVASVEAFPAHAGTATPPGLSVTVSNNQERVVADSQASYTVTVDNAGRDPVTVWVVGTVPDYAAIRDVDGGKRDGHQVTWKLTVGAGKAMQRTLTTRIGTVPPSTYRVTVLAAVYLTHTTSGAPLIGSADSDRIAGVTEPSPSTTETPIAPDREEETERWLPMGLYVGGGLLFVALVVVVATLTWRRSRAVGGRTSGEP